MLNQTLVGLIVKIINLILFILPAYAANSAPIALKTGSSPPIDMKLRWWDRRRILGKGKTILGFIAGIILGTTLGTIIALFFQFYPTFSMQVTAAFLLSLGAMLGDLAGSFVKRRLAFARDKPFYIVDQLSFIVVALIFAYAYCGVPSFLDAAGIAILLIITIILHVVTNYLAYKIGIKKVPH
ncbi:MAG: CDP-2,3-bis-(O-geranylgeranyl)-sn-glycerol synthase [Candidatus Micrarchaeia archaeon]